MVKLLFSTESHYPVSKKLIQDALEAALKNQVKSHVEISVSIVGNRKMRQLNRKYRDINAATDVLSFPLMESRQAGSVFVNPPDNILRLGDIVISYPETLKMARTESIMVDAAIIKLLLHGLNHLMGIHHPE